MKGNPKDSAISSESAASTGRDKYSSLSAFPVSIPFLSLLKSDLLPTKITSASSLMSCSSFSHVCTDKKDRTSVMLYLDQVSL